MSSVLGAMFSGYLMAAVYRLNGVGGYRGWQWYLISYMSSGDLKTNSDHRLFIVDGIISLPIALTGFWLLPDVPEIAKPWYLTGKVL
jgi:ACS family pantothenate transporter-like MFS transporter